MVPVRKMSEISGSGFGAIFGRIFTAIFMAIEFVPSSHHYISRTVDAVSTIFGRLFWNH